MERTKPTLHPVPRDASVPGVFEALAAFGERVSDEPEALEQGLRRMAHDLRENLGVRSLTIEAGVRSGSLSIVEGVPVGGSAVEFPILRGKMLLGKISAFPNGRLSEAQAGELRAAAATISLAISAADTSKISAERAAHRSVIQLASDALGSILDENQLYRTVLMLALGLLNSSAGAVLLEDGGLVSVGFEDQEEEKLRLLGEVKLPTRRPWLGRLGDVHTLGARLGSSEGAIFLLRKAIPYTVAEGVSLKLVAKQLAHARERSRLHAALKQTGLETIKALAAALESRDGTTGDHIRRTELLAERVAVGLELSPEDVQAARYAAVLHDIGKIGVPDAILNKSRKLDETEWEAMKRHPAVGADILSKVTGFERVSRAVLTHHERFDGRGYPAGLEGTQIPVESRIISVVDAYDAMTNDRPYRRALSHEEAVEQLDSGAGSQFDPEVVEVTKAVLIENKGGTTHG